MIALTMTEIILIKGSAYTALTGLMVNSFRIVFNGACTFDENGYKCIWSLQTVSYATFFLTKISFRICNIRSILILKNPPYDNAYTEDFVLQCTS